MKTTVAQNSNLILVDENDRPLDSPREGQNVYHRGVAILVVNPKDEILLHRPRSNTGTAFLPWKSSAYGPVFKNEDYRTAAVRVMQEFFGIQPHPFKFESLDYSRPNAENGNRFIHGYIYRVSGPIEYIRAVPAETTWFKPSDISSAVVAKKMQLSAPLAQILKNYNRLAEYKRRKHSALLTSLNSERHLRLIQS